MPTPRSKSSSIKNKKAGLAAPSEPGDAKSSTTVTISKPDKLMFPAIGLTKGALVEYYERIAPFLLPELLHKSMRGG